MVLRTPKTTLDVVCTTAEDMQCPAEVVGRSGPDSSGLYSYSVRIMNAALGAGTELDVTASNGPGTPVDRDQFALTVVSVPPFRAAKRSPLRLSAAGAAREADRPL